MSVEDGEEGKSYASTNCRKEMHFQIAKIKAKRNGRRWSHPQKESSSIHRFSVWRSFPKDLNRGSDLYDCVLLTVVFLSRNRPRQLFVCKIDAMCPSAIPASDALIVLIEFYFNYGAQQVR